MRIVVFGDSISEGFWDYKMGGWVNMLKTYFWKKNGYENMVMNYGIAAYTTQNVLKSFDVFFDAVARREPGKEKLSTVVIAIGINDASLNSDTQLPRVDEKEFSLNIEKIIQKCRGDELIQRIVFVGNINVDESIINHGDNCENLFYNESIKKYNEILIRHCLENNLEYIDMFGLMDDNDLEDGLHPNSKGHTKIFKKVLNYLDKN